MQGKSSCNEDCLSCTSFKTKVLSYSHQTLLPLIRDITILFFHLVHSEDPPHFSCFEIYFYDN